MKTRYVENDETIVRARQLRQESTPAERKLWSILRGGALDGVKFRRQQRIGPYFADFACMSARLVIEVDGDTHGNAAEYDAHRTAFLKREGFKVLRFTNSDVLSNVGGVAEAIRLVLGPSPSHRFAAGPSLSPEGKGV